ncbi:MAG: hypothetical protein JW854_00345 [Actinobacteria bacterium]|nr:hypothetical protein [Actinomycetota bacterium]
MHEPNDRGKPAAAPPDMERRAARVAARKAELAQVAPVLLSLPWRRIRAGYARIRNMEDFIRFYEMYAPLLAEVMEELVKARESGIYESFDLDASAGGLVVSATDRQGKTRALLEIRKDYWEGEHPPVPRPLPPL